MGFVDSKKNTEYHKPDKFSPHYVSFLDESGIYLNISDI